MFEVRSHERVIPSVIAFSPAPSTGNSSIILGLLKAKQRKFRSFVLMPTITSTWFFINAWRRERRKRRRGKRRDKEKYEGEEDDNDESDENEEEKIEEQEFRD